MSNRPRHLDGADEAVTTPGRAAPTPPGDSAALPAVAASPDSDAGTEEQQETTNAWVLEILCKGGLVVDIRDEDGEFVETPMGRAVPILLAQGALTEDMARGLMTLYEANVARIGAAEHSIGYKSILEAIQRGSRETLYDASSERQEDNPFYGYFAYAVDLGERVIGVSIIEAIAWLEYTGSLNAAEAYYLRITCMENMRQMPYRKALQRDLKPKEIEKELAYLDKKAEEIIDPANDMAKIADLEAQLNEGDFTLHIDMPLNGYQEKPFLEGVFHLKKAKELSAKSGMRLAKLCIDKMLERGKDKDSIARDIESMFIWQVITAEELSELINHVIHDREEAAQRIASAVDLSFDGEDGPPVPAAFVDTRKLERGVRPPDDVPTYPKISLLITGRRLVLIAAGLLVVAVGGAGTALYTNLRGRNDANTTDAAVTVGITSTETDGEPAPESEPHAVDPARFGSEAEAPAPEPVPTPARKPAPAGPTPAPQATPAAATPAPQAATSPSVPLTAESEAPQSITIPVTIKRSSSGSLKIDTTDEARAAWVTMGYTVSVSMGLNGKIIRLTDSKGNVYQVETENLTAATTELPAILRAAQ